MANTQSALYGLTLTVTETIDLDIGAAEFLIASDNPTIEHKITGTSGTLTATTTPAVTKTWSARSALTAGAETIDLTSLTGQGGTSIDMSGLELILVKFMPNGANKMTIGDGAVTGYPVLGAASKAVDVPTGGSLLFYSADGIGQVVDATHKHIDIAGTTTQTYDIILVFG